MRMSEKVLVIGLDGATFDIIDAMVAGGRLPHLSRLMAQGSRGALRSTVPPVTPPAWTSFMTGMNPARHGVFDFMHHSKDGPGGDLRFVSYRSIAAPTLWDILSEKKKRVIAINVPVTYPPPEVNGIIISGLMTPNDAPCFVHPPEMQDEINRMGYRVDFHPLTDIRNRRKEEWLRDYFDIEERRLEAGLKLIREQEWDLFMIVFGITDRIQHFCWDQLEGEPPYSPDVRGSVPDAYELADRMIGKLLEEVDDGTSVFILSDHGFGTVEKVFFTNRWLRDEGFLSLKSVSITRWRDTHAFRLYPVRLGALLGRMGLGAVAGRLPSRIAEVVIKVPLIRRKVSPAVVDWSRTQAYGDSFGIYINSKGREAGGIVDREEYERIRDRIIDRLLEFREPGTGEKIVDIALRREEVYEGPYMETAPDVIFQIKNLSYLQNRSFYFRKLFIPADTGNHRLEGIFLASGPGIKKGFTVDGAEIIDLVPTILYAMDLGIPSDVDGTMLEAVFKDDYRSAHQVRIEPATGVRRITEHDVYTADELEKIKASLTALGYLS